MTLPNRQILTPDALRQAHAGKRGERLNKAREYIDGLLEYSANRLLAGDDMSMASRAQSNDAFNTEELIEVITEYQEAGWLVEERHIGDFAPGVPEIIYVFRMPDDK